MKRQFTQPIANESNIVGIVISHLNRLKGSVNQSNRQIDKMQRILSTNPSSSLKFAVLQEFSSVSKHPYLNLSVDKKTVKKVSHTGHRFAAVGATRISAEGVRLCIDRSESGQVMVGLCMESIVRQKNYTDCYGCNQGTYLIAQDNNGPAISFHHSSLMYNRKEIVGWTFTTGDIISVEYKEQNIIFKKQGKKECVFAMRAEQGQEHFRLVVLLQREGDQISILDV